MPFPRLFGHFSRSEMPLAIYRFPRQMPVELHEHPFVELVVIVSGACVHFTETEEYKVAAGDVFSILPGTAHGYRDALPEDPDFGLINILFDPQALQLPVHDLQRLPGYHALFTVEPRLRRKDSLHERLHLNPEEVDRIDRICSRIEQETEAKAPGYQFTAMSYLMQILSSTARAYSLCQQAEPHTMIRLGQVLSHVEDHYHEEIRVDDLARMANMSESTFVRAFRKATETSPIDYLIQLRIRKARGLLRTTDLRVCEIAERVGFTDANYFARQFKKIASISPSDYRSRFTN